MLSTPAEAHPLKITGVVVRIDGASTSVTITAHAPANDIAQRLRLNLDGQPFIPAGVSLTVSQDIATWTAHEDRRAQSVSLESPLFPEIPDNTTVMLVYRDGQLADRAVLGESRWPIIRRFVKMGIFHILSGPDHILFVLGLIMMGGPWRRLLAVITAFTLAHSITLSLTALGIASISPRIVEPVIALSIVAVGIENLFHSGTDLPVRIGLAFGFGFFHGFGFAGALAEAGLPPQSLAWSLASFNAGVEIGQLCILAMALPLVTRASPLVTRLLSAGIALAGAIWFAARV